MISLSLSPTTASTLAGCDHSRWSVCACVSNIPALAFIQSTVTGALNESWFALNFLSASVVPVASATTLLAWAGPRYSRMLVSWSAVGGFS